MVNTVIQKYLYFDFSAAYDFLNSDLNKFNVSIWYNSTYKNGGGNSPIDLVRVPRSVNLVCIENCIIIGILFVVMHFFV